MSEPRDLIDAMRRVITAARIADLDEQDFQAEIAELDALADRLDAVAVDDVRMQAGLHQDELMARFAANLTGGPTERLNRALEIGVNAFFPYSPYIGALNPMAPPVEFETVVVDGGAELQATHTFAPIVNGPPGGVHGGVLAGVFDELLGSTCVVNDVSGFTGTLSIRYSSLTPLGEPITMRGWVDRVEGRKTFARGTFHHGETLTAEAEGIFIGPKS
ncbi:MAG: hotdog domain-containing protein [Actinomycetota bacterium]